MRIVSLVISMFLLASGSVQAKNFVVLEDGQMLGYQMRDTALYDSTLHVLINGQMVDDPGFFNHSLSPRYDFAIPVHKGDHVSFELSVHDTGDNFFSNSLRNSDGIDHFVYQYDSVSHSLFVKSEDLLGGGDFDFDDNVVMYTNISPVPEPETYAMMLAGLGVLYMFKKKNPSKQKI